MPGVLKHSCCESNITSNSTQRGTLMQASTKTLAEIRSDVCDSTLIVMLGFAVPAVGASLLRIIEQGWLPVMALHIALVVVLVFVTACRKSLPYTVRAGYAVALMFAVGAAGISFFALSTGVIGFLIGSAILAGVFFSACGAAPPCWPSVLYTWWLYLFSSEWASCQGPRSHLPSMRRRRGSRPLSRLPWQARVR